MPYHKNTRKEDLINVLKEIGEQATSKETIIQLKTKLEKSAAFKNDPDFVINLLNLSVEDRQTKAERQLQETNSQPENVVDLKSLVDLMISDKFFDTLEPETASHIKIMQADEWMTPDELGKACDIFFTSKNGSLHEVRNPNTFKNWPTRRCKRRMGEPTTENGKCPISERRVGSNREDLVWKQDEAMDFALMREEERTCFKYLCFCILNNTEKSTLANTFSHQNKGLRQVAPILHLNQ
ncbi:hypothetical protein TNCV_213531 [Trichonephila clavipes]|nr:hypothetical protein TNCV_213531 [Trichonephila clavipes]